MAIPSLPSIRQLEYIVAVADEKHFRRAARRVGVSQPALSTQVRALEEQLGVAIFERGSRNVMITEAGAPIIERARRVLVEARELVEVAHGASEPLAGALRLGVIPTVAPFLLPEVLPRVRQIYPSLELFLIEDHTDRLVDALEAGSLDVLLLALGVRGTERNGLTALPIFEEPFWLAVYPGHRLAGAERVELGDLDGEEVLLLEDGH